MPGPWVKSTNSIMRRADVVLVLGGRMATLQAGMAAPALGKTPVALSAFGGAGKQVFDALVWSYIRAGLGGDPVDSLQKPFDSAEAAGRIVDFALQLSKGNPFRIKTGIAWRVAMFAFSLLLIAAWIAVLGLGAQHADELARGERHDADVRPPATAAGAAAPPGSATGAPPAGDPAAAVSPPQDIGDNTWYLVGILLAFSFLLVYLMGGLLYDGDALDVSPASFRRVATAVSVLGLASAFLLETAIVEIRNRFGQILRR